MVLLRHSLVFWHSLLLVSLVLFISMMAFLRRGHWPPPSFSAQRAQPLGSALNASLKGISISLEWRIDLAQQSAHFRVSLDRPAAVLVGFSDHGRVEGSDFCLFELESQKMLDGWIDRKGVLRRDVHQDCELTELDSPVQFQFSRRLATCDPRDYRIELQGTTNLLLAVTQLWPVRSLREMAHQMRYVLMTGRKGGQERRHSLESNLRTMDIRAQNVSVPAQVTTYWCAIVELEEHIRKRKHHVVKYEAVISPGSEQLVHHFEVFHCQKPTRPFSGDCSTDKPAEARSCSRVLAAWAMGANAVVYPPEAGMPIGGPNFVPFLMVEIHYNNVDRVAGLRDSSGLRVTYTDRLRPNDAGIMELGLIYSDANSIPPGQAAFPLSAFCPAECTQKFPAGGINIFASQLHAHLAGRKLFTSLLRKGTKVAEVNRDNHYSPHWQHIQTLQPQVRAMPGDVLATTCVYETKGLTRWTWGGYGIEDEMCVNYIHYYPASEVPTYTQCPSIPSALLLVHVEVCKSAVSNTSLHAFFSRMGLRGDRRLRIDQKYSAVRWTEAKLALLREFYRVSPLNVACLQHSGQPFPGHPNNWTRVPRPEFTASPADAGATSEDECPALND